MIDSTLLFDGDVTAIEMVSFNLRIPSSLFGPTDPWYYGIDGTHGLGDPYQDVDVYQSGVSSETFDSRSRMVERWKVRSESVGRPC